MEQVASGDDTAEGGNDGTHWVPECGTLALLDGAEEAVLSRGVARANGTPFQPLPGTVLPPTRGVRSTNGAAVEAMTATLSRKHGFRGLKL